MRALFRIFLFLSMMTMVAAGQNRLPEITNPVATDFGVYQPQLVAVKPDAPRCDSGANLDKVINLKEFDLSSEAIGLLKKNHFVATPITRPRTMSSSTGFNEMFDLYCENRERNVPNFITSDAVLHAFHLCFDNILKVCEEKRFIEQLNQLLDGMLAETINQIKDTNAGSVHSALDVNLNYLIVAKKLLDSAYVEPINGGPYLQEFDLIQGAAGFAESPIFKYTEDYSQYIVRGHYTRTGSLRRYFQSMMWLGRMTFSCEHVDNAFSREATRSALLLIQAFQRIRVNGQPAMTVWDDIYQPTVFFVGKSDDINFINFLPLVEQTYGVDFAAASANLFQDELLLTQLLNKTAVLPQAAIPYPGQPAKGFRFMGQRFIPDSWVLSELVFPKVPSRFMPTGLDVMQVLGSDRAFELLPDKNRNDPLYVHAVDSLKNVFAAYPAATWAQNLYWNWLYALMPLLWEKGEGYPYFMQTSAWVDKDLYSALASWAELRHDTILYAKQSGTKTSIPPSALTVQGYVEPNPHFFGRIAALAEFMIQGLRSRDLLFDDFNTTLALFSETSLQLKAIAEKQLSREPLTSLDYALIFDFGKTLFKIVTFGKGGPEGPTFNAVQSGLEPMPVIADVHTDANSGTVLEEGVGHPYAIYVICNIEGRPMLTRGAGFSYFEFTWPMNDRLTDEKWRRQLTSNNPPQPVAWSSSFTADLPANNPAPTFYSWQKPNSCIFYAVFDSSKQTLVKGDSMTVVIRASPYEQINPPNVQIFSDQAQWSVDDVTPIAGNTPLAYQALFDTEQLPPGLYYLVISVPIQGDTLMYRTHFYLAAKTQVVDQVFTTNRFELYPNWPNPFNGSTTIAYDLSMEQNVNVEIYNIKGEKIKTLFTGRQPAGRHQIQWDAGDAAGKPMSSGVYFIRLNGQDIQQIKSISLIK